MLMPEHAGRCLKSAHDRGSELRDERPILALDPFAAFDGLKRDGVSIQGLAGVRGTGLGHD
jgi:hypothetical protein